MNHIHPYTRVRGNKDFMRIEHKIFRPKYFWNIHLEDNGLSCLQRLPVLSFSHKILLRCSDTGSLMNDASLSHSHAWETKETRKSRVLSERKTLVGT